MVPAIVMPGTGTPYHHGSHRRLLWTADDSPSPQANVDAIIVPTVRPPAYLREAARVALLLDCPLVTLHSRKWTSAQQAALRLPPAVDLIAIDVPDRAQLRLPDLETSRLLAGTIFERRTDLSAKRNLALMLCYMLGWERVVFLDDDIRIPNAVDLRHAAGLLDTYNAVGLGIGGYPDNSVVCHAFRLAGGAQETFIGGGALAVEVKRNRSFFPDVYNDDWFYMLNAGKDLQPVATVGEVLQQPYDPFRNPDRARAEEFGDVLAEGTFWLLDQEKSAADADWRHWRDFLERRQRFIRHVLGMVVGADIEPTEKARMVEALKAALGRLACIRPERCVDYLRALAADQDKWQHHVHHLPTSQPLDKALRSLSRKGTPPLTWYTTQARRSPAMALRAWQDGH
ncbi:MAG TPA: hypothetical protein DHU96_22865 [Actinobacteria bacterium]|nr:hypothetical protein [Actinomycetota bacterium]